MDMSRLPPSKPRGRKPQPKKKSKPPRTQPLANLQYFNACTPCHLALPRRVGPYTVVRTTQLFSSLDSVLIFGAFRLNNATTGSEWANVACVSSGTATSAINAASNAYCTRFDQLTAYSTTYLNGFELAPAALTVRVLNGAALQTTSGIVYAGRAASQLNMADATRTWNSLAAQFVASQSPRPMSAAKLAMRGVAISSYPLDMTDISDFRPLDSTTSGTFTWSSGSVQPVGLAPIIVHNSTGGLLSLTFEVTMEWRVRFDLSDLASTTHQLHPVAPQSVWDETIDAAVAMGHGVVDLTEDIIAVGGVVSSVAGLLSL